MSYAPTFCSRVCTSHVATFVAHLSQLTLPTSELIDQFVGSPDFFTCDVVCHRKDNRFSILSLFYTPKFLIGLASLLPLFNLELFSLPFRSLRSLFRPPSIPIKFESAMILHFFDRIIFWQVNHHCWSHLHITLR